MYFLFGVKAVLYLTGLVLVDPPRLVGKSSGKGWKLGTVMLILSNAG